jgi:hypothetical protein
MSPLNLPPEPEGTTTMNDPPLDALILAEVEAGVGELADIFSDIKRRWLPDLTYRQLVWTVADLITNHELVPVSVAIPAENRIYVVTPEKRPAVSHSHEHTRPGVIPTSAPSERTQAK